MGQKFGKLTVLEKTAILNKSRGVVWYCRCDCGGNVSVRSSNLVEGKTRSCGCLRREFLASGNAGRVHGKYGTPEHTRKWSNERNAQRKQEVLTHYGKNGTLRCCAEDCQVVDIDMLTLDHINNDGAKHRAEDKALAGSKIYRWAIANSFPIGFQTLCWNHQAKKALILARKNRKENYAYIH